MKLFLKHLNFEDSYWKRPGEGCALRGWAHVLKETVPGTCPETDEEAEMFPEIYKFKRISDILFLKVGKLPFKCYSLETTPVQP